MELVETARQIADGVLEHPRRVLASSLGVFWGAAAIIFLMSFGAGFREYMNGEWNRFGDGVIVMWGATTSSGFAGHRRGVQVELSREDAAAVEREHPELLRAVLPEHASFERVLVEGGGRVRRLDLSASDQRYIERRNFDIGWGRPFEEWEVLRARAVALLGIETATTLFGSPEAAVGQRLRVSGRPFEVVGVARRKGRQYINTHRPDDELLIVPISAAEQRLGFDDESVSRLLLFPRPGQSPDEVARAAIATLAERVGFHPDDTDAVKWFDTSRYVMLSDLFYAGFMIFIGVAGTITLLIGAVGIANYHLATLSERSLEIAVAKAIGARNGRIVRHVILEALAVSGSASLLGVALGAAGCVLLARLAPAGAFPTPILSPVALAATALAVLGVSLVAAVIPAARVRSMGVSQALRG